MNLKKYLNCNPISKAKVGLTFRTHLIVIQIRCISKNYYKNKGKRINFCLRIKKWGVNRGLIDNKRSRMRTVIIVF